MKRASDINTNLVVEAIDLLQSGKDKETGNIVITKLSPRERVKWLVQTLRELPGAFQDANGKVKEAVLCLATKIEKKPIIFPNGQRSHPNHFYFARTPVVNLFCEALEPVINELYSEFTNGYFMLRHAGLWPFRDALMRTEKAYQRKIILEVDSSQKTDYLKLDLDQKINSLNREIEHEQRILDDVLNKDPYSTLGGEIIRTGETMMLISATMSAINNSIFDESEINFCACCFRRASGKLKYCHIHDSNTENTRNKQGKKHHKKLSRKNKLMMLRYRKIRLLLNDEPLFWEAGSIHGDVGVESGKNFVALSPYEQELFARTLDGKWSSVMPLWLEAIDDRLPLISRKLKTTEHYDNSENWNHFVSVIFNALQEKKESVTHPYWILRILVAAEAWFECEQKTRKMEKPKKFQFNAREVRIYEMAEQGVKSCDIAKMINVSPPYVSKVLKKRASVLKMNLCLDSVDISA
jgi:hypothetical protein